MRCLSERASETLAAVAMLQEAGRHRYASNRALGIEPGRMGRSDGSDQVERHCLSHRREWPRPGSAESGGLSVNVTPPHSGIDEAEARKAYVSLRRGLAILRAGGTADEAVAACKSLEKYPALRPMYRCDEAGAQTLQAVLKDPEWSVEAGEFLRQVNQPTLAIFGKRDAVVDWRESIDVYRSAFEQSGNRNLTVKAFDEADHEMLPSSNQRLPDSIFVPGYVETMISWLEARAFTASRP